MKIYVYESVCVHCRNTFYDLENERLTCPHCLKDAADAIANGVHASYAVFVEPRNGELALIKV